MFSVDIDKSECRRTKKNYNRRSSVIYEQVIKKDEINQLVKGENNVLTLKGDTIIPVLTVFLTGQHFKVSPSLIRCRQY